MNTGNIQRLNDNQDLSSQSSDEKMDTGSESLLSTQDTPNSVLSSDFEDREQSGSETNDEVLRLQNPQNIDVLRLSEPKDGHNNELNNSLITKMSKLRLDSLDVEDKSNRPKNLGISPPKFISTLTLTNYHPLMGIGSPDSSENYPDLIPKKAVKKEEDSKDLSLSSIEEEKNCTNLYSLEKNTSKNNLYFNENFVTADSQLENLSRIESSAHTPDVTRVSAKLDNGRRKIIACIQSGELSKGPDTSTPKRMVENGSLSAIKSSLATPMRQARSDSLDVPSEDVYHSAVAEWCESPSQLRRMPNFELPIEMSTDIAAQTHDLDSPDVVSSSTQEDRSTYQALVDPYSGSVALRHTTNGKPLVQHQRRRIALPPENDTQSIDSFASDCSLGSEEDLPPPPPPKDTVSVEEEKGEIEKRNSISSSSEPIPEYSAAEEFQEERAWLKVPLPTGGYSTCDMKVIEPYKRVLSHGGYSGAAALIVLSGCHLPDTARPDYYYVMDNLFLYVIWSLERLVTEEYILVYLHGGGGARRVPTYRAARDCYKLVNHRLRKSVKQVYLVHPNWWIRSVLAITKPFISSKFYRKLVYVKNLKELMEKLPIEPNAIPDLVKEYDARR